MNYIHKLQAELLAARAELDAKEQAVHDFRAHLSGEKFQGFEPDGSRKDWIAVADVLAWLQHIASIDVPATVLSSPMEGDFQ